MIAFTRLLTLTSKTGARFCGNNVHRHPGVRSLGTRQFTHSTRRAQEEPQTGGKKPLDEARTKMVSTEEELEERVAQLLEKAGTRGSGGGNSSMMDAALTAAFGLGLGMFIGS